MFDFIIKSLTGIIAGFGGGLLANLLIRRFIIWSGTTNLFVESVHEIEGHSNLNICNNSIFNLSKVYAYITIKLKISVSTHFFLLFFILFYFKKLIYIYIYIFFFLLLFFF